MLALMAVWLLTTALVCSVAYRFGSRAGRDELMWTLTMNDAFKFGNWPDSEGRTRIAGCKCGRGISVLKAERNRGT